MKKRNMKQSQRPYKIDTSSIGEIITAKAGCGDKDAIKAVNVLLKYRRGKYGHNDFSCCK